MTGKSSGKTEKTKGKYYTIDGRRWRYLGSDEKGQEKFEESPVKKSKMGKAKKKPSTNYKSTGSKKGKPKKRKSLM